MSQGFKIGDKIVVTTDKARCPKGTIGTIARLDSEDAQILIAPWESISVKNKGYELESIYDSPLFKALS